MSKGLLEWAETSRFQIDGFILVQLSAIFCHFFRWEVFLTVRRNLANDCRYLDESSGEYSYLFGYKLEAAATL